MAGEGDLPPAPRKYLCTYPAAGASQVPIVNYLSWGREASQMHETEWR